MKTLKIIFIFFSFWTTSYSQGGSNIRYFKTSDIDNLMIGKDVHLDFFKRSFKEESIDTVTIIIDDKSLNFREVRNDNGCINWFSGQYLQSVNTGNKQTIRISKCKLEYITANAFKVLLFIDYYDEKEKLIKKKSKQQEYWFDKKNIVEVLVKS